MSAAGVEEHWRLVLFTLTDDDDAVHGHRVQHVAHGIHGGPVGPLLVAPAHPPGGGQRGRLGDPTEVESEVAVGYLGVDSHGE